MASFRSRLSRYNTIDCDQVMPVPRMLRSIAEGTAVMIPLPTQCLSGPKPQCPPGPQCQPQCQPQCPPGPQCPQYPPFSMDCIPPFSLPCPPPLPLPPGTDVGPTPPPARQPFEPYWTAYPSGGSGGGGSGGGSITIVDPQLQILPYPLAYLPPPGTILHNTINSLPDGFLVCDGSLLDRNEYSVLFQMIGTFYGSGDGVTTFQLPTIPMNVPYEYIIRYILQVLPTDPEDIASFVYLEEGSDVNLEGTTDVRLN